MIETMSKLRNVSKRLLQQLGREPSIEEMANSRRSPLTKSLRVMVGFKHPISLTGPVGESEDSYFGDFIEDESAELVNAATRKCSRTRSSGGPQDADLSRSREIIKFAVMAGMATPTRRRGGPHLQGDASRVRQIEAKASGKLQHPVRSRQLEGFLDTASRQTAAAQQAARS